ncbi:hypothetical protein [Streptomyces sp. CA-106110]|uniref:hypothetical protein n=1 Tax=Streptomyces sp. CA-106110 TaxID=3240044 RepID=UPI003D8E5C27
MSRDVYGQWDIVQTGGHTVVVHVFQTALDGNFDGAKAVETDSGYADITESRVTNDEITFLIPWSSGARGRYTGRFDSQGRMTGVCFDEAHPENVASWYARKEPDNTFPFRR